MAYQGTSYLAGWILAIVCLIPVFPMTFYCICSLWPEWDRREKFYERGGVLWYFAATKDPENQFDDRKIEGRCPSCKTRIEFDSGEIPACSVCVGKTFGTDGEYNDTKKGVIRDAIKDWKNQDGFEWVHWSRKWYCTIALLMLPLVIAFAYVTRPQNVTGKDKSQSAPNFKSEEISSRNSAIVHDLSVLLQRGQVISHQCQGAYPKEFKPGETIRKKYSAWYEDVNGSFRRLGLDYDVYHAKLENTPDGYCILPFPPPCISQEHCRVYCEVGMRLKTLSGIIREFEGRP